MATLTFDTTSTVCAVHLKRADGIVHEAVAEIGRGHAEHLIGMIDRALGALGLDYADLRRLGVATGPGSFAGIRVGLSAARGLALALEIPLAGVSVLRALAAEHGQGGPSLVILDAGRDAFYAELFDASGHSPEGPLLHRKQDPFPRQWMDAPGLALIGSGAAYAGALLARTRMATLASIPSIATIARLCEADSAPVRPKPLYLRPPDAKPQASAGLVARRTA
ncbi:MAG: tRNA (adenosine(37)-N6)-threonylcarbamoyltransferase complex dimerization subunit type 1 TsaB [Rhizobiales bacterium]|nr:tRNA (adenosine(37)-N6)-threonylcarbamoyltransferase complex dimerization subunit type 1 TsaB [Hyphomicrobiales bacterium]